MLVIIIGLAGCSREVAVINRALPETRPSDFSLNIDWSTGMLPDPEMLYSYQVRIGPGEEGRFFYRSGDGLHQFNTSFDLTADSLDRLYAYLLEESVFRLRFEEGEPIDGGPVVYISLTANKRTYSYPLLSELSAADRQRAQVILDSARDLVPQDCWSEMNRLQAERLLAED